jgi:uncharacterized protein
MERHDSDFSALTKKEQEKPTGLKRSRSDADGEEAGLILAGEEDEDPKESTTASCRLDTPNPKRRKSCAKSISEYLASPFRYCPRPDWLQKRATVFGKDWDTALHVAIRENATEASMELIRYQRELVTRTNNKGVTPLILAAQKGNSVLVQELLRHGADPAVPSSNGTTAALQASHFGHVETLKLLLLVGGPTVVEQSNSNHTTCLMRASQEGHEQAVKLLLQHNARVNRRNRAQMSALMLAGQRGHTAVCRLLIAAGADLNAKTDQDSTVLQLACRRGNVDVVKCLVEAGCELWIKDSRGRTARQVTLRRLQGNGTNGGANNATGVREDRPDQQQQLRRQVLPLAEQQQGHDDQTTVAASAKATQDILDLLDPAVQIDLIQRESRRQRSFCMLHTWTQLQRLRPGVPIEHECAQHQYHHQLSFLAPPDASKQALVRTMALPAPLVQAITQFLPLPKLWNRRMAMLQRTCFVNANAAVLSALDLVDEILEEGGFLEACDKARVPAPPPFENWANWKRQKHGPVVVERDVRDRVNVTTATIPLPKDPRLPSVLEMRRLAGYLPTLARYSDTLGPILTGCPYNVPPAVLHKLCRVADVASLMRRVRHSGSVTLEANVAMDMILIINRLASWHGREQRHTAQLLPPLFY